MEDKVVISKEKLDSLADSINEKAGTSGNKSIDELRNTVENIYDNYLENAEIVDEQKPNEVVIVLNSLGNMSNATTQTTLGETGAWWITNYPKYAQ